MYQSCFDPTGKHLQVSLAPWEFYILAIHIPLTTHAAHYVSEVKLRSPPRYWHEDAMGPLQQFAVGGADEDPIFVQEGARAGKPAVPHPHPAIPANCIGIPETPDTDRKR